MARSTLPKLAGGRYQLQQLLGSGAMGTVFRAYDRLDSTSVALKQVALSSPPPGSTKTHLDQRVALAREFRTLATLRHPGIIRVRDYGFDQDGAPFFTMELLAEAQPLTVLTSLSLAEQLDLLKQILEALAYLHRHGVLHRDLKPANVLVARQRAYLLDFGLAAQRDEAQGRTGTLRYMAPEVLRAGTASEAADLYAVGMLGYELLTGRYPFADAPRSLPMAILNQQPDLAALPPTLAPVIGRLLAKDPAARYPSAEATLAALAEAGGLPPPVESTAIRESFLQAAVLVGREPELATLRAALASARQGQAGFWLIEGESGVGKSRLLDEIGTLALVEGALVLHGQAIEGSTPQALWNDVLCRTALVTPLSELEVAVLTPLAPGLAHLLELEPSPPPALPAREARQRVIQTISAVLSRVAAQAAPIVLILEDLHWLPSEHDLLAALARLHSIPLLIVGSYRTDEHVDLAQIPPDAQRLTLQRLDATAVATLSTAMLGAGGRNPEVVSLLRRISEGNAFFLVETVRALAEEAGGLAYVGQRALPSDVFAGGVRRIVQRRLARVPAHYQEALALAAILGRQFDPAVLGAALPELELEAFVRSVADAAVYEANQEGYRFAHDRLRTGLIESLEPTTQQALHRHAARALMLCYGDADAYAGMIADHWASANEPAQELPYLQRAAKIARQAYANDEALARFARLIEHPALDQTGRHLAQLEHCDILIHIGQIEPAEAILVQLEVQTDPADQHLALEHAWIRIGMYERRGDFATSQAVCEAALQLDPVRDDPLREAQLRAALGTALWNQGALATARTQLETAIERFVALTNLQGEASSLIKLGIVYALSGEPEAAQRCFERSATLSRQINDQQGLANALANTSALLEYTGQASAARPFMQDCLVLFRKLGDRWSEAKALTSLGMIALAEQDLVAARTYIGQAAQIQAQLGDQDNLARGLVALGEIAMAEGKADEAEQHWLRSLSICRTIGNKAQASDCLLNLSELVQQRSDQATALTYLREGLQLAEQIGEPRLIAGNLLVVAALPSSDPYQAAQLVAAVTANLTRIGMPVEGVRPERYHQLVAHVERVLDPATLAQAQTSGASLSLVEAIQRAWQLLHEPH
ncbi:MAG: serine/threonine-protein kinase PknK [Oscillochloridaceae bacterium umkhey_bin13]